MQLVLARARPSNYGVTTTIIMRLIHHTCHFPIIEKDYLWDALRDLRFEEIHETFRMFVLHDLNMDGKYISEIVTEDPPTVGSTLRAAQIERQITLLPRFHLFRAQKLLQHFLLDAHQLIKNCRIFWLIPKSLGP